MPLPPLAFARPACQPRGQPRRSMPEPWPPLRLPHNSTPWPLIRQLAPPPAVSVAISQYSSSMLPIVDAVGTDTAGIRIGYSGCHLDRRVAIASFRPLPASHSGRSHRVIPALSRNPQTTPSYHGLTRSGGLPNRGPPNLIFFHGSDIRPLRPNFTNPYTQFIRRTIVYPYHASHARVSGLAANPSVKIAY